MTLPEPRTLTMLDATIDLPDVGRIVTSLRVHGSRIAAIGCDPQPDDLVIDLRGDRLLPGLINAHDHLQLNGFPPPGCLPQYANVREWIAAINHRLQTDRAFQAAAAVPRVHRLLHGGLKNLLGGVTTVAHHDPLYDTLSDEFYPIRIVTRYGWSHSLGIDSETQVRRSYERTPVDWPWIIHAAEGLDAEAAAEYARLAALGCVDGNTVVVHGVALGHEEREHLAEADAGLVWCPTSNLRLFGRTADVADLVARGRVALGSDSRLSGARDLLDELRAARDTAGLDEATLESLVTGTSARLLRLADRGSIKVGALADLLVLPRALVLSRAVRGEIRMVMVGGCMRYGDLDYAHAIAPASEWTQVTVDGRRKALERGLAAALSRVAVHEPGLELREAAWEAA